MKYYILKIEKHNLDCIMEPTYVMLFSIYEKALEHLNNLIEKKLVYGSQCKIVEVEIDKTKYSTGSIYEGEF